MHGVAIAARNLIPAIYEARAFAPEWRTVSQIDGLLEVIGDSFLEGLDPADYHVEAVRERAGRVRRSRNARARGTRPTSISC